MANPYLQLVEPFQTITDFLRFGLSRANAAQLHYGHGSDNAWDDILALVLGSLNLPLDMNPALLEARLCDDEKQFLGNQLYKRIEQRVPTPYLTHQAYFFGLTFYVDERVLIPRSPLGELISQQFSPWVDASSVTNVLDLCTGSGCLAIACSYAFPDALVDAADISEQALAVATLNRANHGLSQQLNLIHSDCFKGIPEKRYDIIVSNPPYVGQAEMQTLPKEYLHEPELALEADDNGLALVAVILQNAKHYLKDDGILVVEVGNSEQALIDAYPDIPFTWLEFEHGGEGVFLLTSGQLNAYF